MSGPLLGCIADDFTGATDLANNLVRSGMRTVQAIGVPASEGTSRDADAIVIALKSRTIVIDEVSNKAGWNGWIGCEYRPALGIQPGATAAGLGWLNKLVPARPGKH